MTTITINSNAIGNTGTISVLNVSPATVTITGPSLFTQTDGISKSTNKVFVCYYPTTGSTAANKTGNFWWTIAPQSSDNADLGITEWMYAYNEIGLQTITFTFIPKILGQTAEKNNYKNGIFPGYGYYMQTKLPGSDNYINSSLFTIVADQLYGTNITISKNLTCGFIQCNGINNTGDGITNAGAISEATTITASGEITCSMLNAPTSKITTTTDVDLRNYVNSTGQIVNMNFESSSGTPTLVLWDTPPEGLHFYIVLRGHDATLQTITNKNILYYDTVLSNSRTILKSAVTHVVCAGSLYWISTKQ
jgi:hypothetical protein